MVRNMHDEDLHVKFLSKPLTAQETVVFIRDVCHRGHFYSENFVRGYTFLVEDSKATRKFNRECVTITPVHDGGCMVSYSHKAECVRAGKDLACKKSCGLLTLKFEPGQTVFTDRACFCRVGELDSDACVGGAPRRPKGFPQVPAVFP